jgi:hypothetical protein
MLLLLLPDSRSRCAGAMPMPWYAGSLCFIVVLGVMGQRVKHGFFFTFRAAWLCSRRGRLSVLSILPPLLARVEFTASRVSTT